MSSRARSYPYAPDPSALPLMRGEVVAGWLLGRIVVGLAAWAVLGAAAAGVLSLLGWWHPVTAGVALLVLAVVSARVAALVPARPVPVWSATLALVIAVAATLWAGATHAEQVLPRRDSGSNLQAAIELATSHARVVDVPAGSVGGPDVLRIEGLTLASPAFYQVGSPADPAIQPQFTIGASSWWSVARWLGGEQAVFWAPAVVGGLGILAVALLTVMTVGPRWAPLAALGLALCFPLLHVNRSTYSEPLAVFVLLAGLAVLAQAARSARAMDVARARAAGLVAGFLLGGGILLRVDSLREVFLLAPVAALAALQRQRHAGALALGAGVTAALALGLTWLTSSEYLRSIGGSLLPLSLLGAALVVLSLGLVLVGRRASLPAAATRVLPAAAAAAVLLVGVFLASRPLWQTVRQSAADPGSRVVAGLQLRQGLPVDGGRTYAEQSVVWLSWWVGPAALVLALLAAALLAHRAAATWVDGIELPSWTGPLLVALGSTALTLYRPGITPDHPWADRRLVIAVATVVLLVTGLTAVVTRWSARRLPASVLVVASSGCALALLVPTALATWPHRDEHVEEGQLTAVTQVCEAFRPGDVALMVDSRAANEWPQVLRGQCRVPALSTTSGLRRDPTAFFAAVGQVERAVEARGSNLVLVAADSEDALRALGVERVQRAVKPEHAVVREDPRLLEERPDSLVPLSIQVWLGRTG